jgi:hypothetical protein
MNKTQNLLTGFGLALVSAVFWLNAVQSTTAAEPVYDGKALSEWLFALHVNLSDEEMMAATRQNVDAGRLREQKQGQAQEAIRQIGTNGLPTLLDLVNVGEGNRRSVARRVKSKDIQKCLRDSNPSSREAVRGMAVEGFGLLGTNAEAAVPQLNRLLHSDSEGLMEAANILAQMGPKGFAVLTNAVNSELDGILVLAIGQKCSDVQAVTRFLIASLRSSSPVTRGNAAKFLAGKDASLAVPALIRVLDDSQDYAWRAAAISLGCYGSVAKDAVPKLFSLYTNHVDVFVMGALTSIDREAAGRAEEFLVNSGPLNAARRGYSRTKLTNGMELIAGGVMDTQIIAMTNHFLASAQLLDPKTGKWTETGQLNIARFGHKATLLPDGKILVEGGHGEPSIPGRFPPSLSSKELYNPNTGTWTVVTNK